MNKKLQVIKYISADVLSAALAWTIFFMFRKYTVDHTIFSHIGDVFLDSKLYLGILVVPIFWLILYILIGTYRKIYRKGRLREFGQTVLISFIGVTILFFTLILDDIIINNKTYIEFFFTLLGLHLLFTASFRVILTSSTAYKIHNKICLLYTSDAADE